MKKQNYQNLSNTHPESVDLEPEVPHSQPRPFPKPANDNQRRWISKKDAAAFAGVCTNTFMSEVAAGVWPQPRRSGRRLLWDIKALDRASDAMSGFIAANDNGVNDWDARFGLG